MKMKATYIKIITLLIVFCGFSSCNSWLDNQPEGKIVLNDFWKSEADVDAMITTCYRSMIEVSYMERLFIWGELRSDNVTPSSAFSENTIGKIEEANILPTNSYSDWSSFYKVINYCNLVLYWAPQVIDPNFTASELRARESEALAIRSLTYFYLVRAYKNVPLVLTPSSSDNQNYQIPQSTEDEVLDQLEKDLLVAESKAVVSYSLSKYNKGRFTKNSIRAILADIYLWRNKYADCVTYCDKLIAEPAYKLIEADMNPFNRIFSMKNSAESIFELQFESANNFPNSMISSFYGNKTKEHGTFAATDFICKGDKSDVFSYLPLLTDVRRKDNVGKSNAQEGFAIFKYAGQSRQESSDGLNSTYYYRESLNYPNWIIYRITDIILMKAEALVELDRSEADRIGAVHMVNLVYMRSNPTLLNTDTVKFDSQSTKSDMQERVLLERQRELMFEGKRWFDLLRVARRDGNTNKLVDKVIRKYIENASMVRSKMKDMNSLYWPINDTELKSNPTLVQNPYYLTKVTN